MPGSSGVDWESGKLAKLLQELLPSPRRTTETESPAPPPPPLEAENAPEEQEQPYRRNPQTEA